MNLLHLSRFVRPVALAVALSAATLGTAQTASPTFGRGPQLAAQTTSQAVSSTSLASGQTAANPTFGKGPQIPTTSSESATATTPTPTKPKSAAEAVKRLTTPSTVTPAASSTWDTSPATPPGTATTALADPSKTLNITLSASTSHIIEGSAYGLDAEFKNTSQSPVALPLDLLSLSVQPELGPAAGMCAFPYPISQTSSTWVLLMPGDNFTAVFDLGAHAEKATKINPSCIATRMDRYRKAVDFVPGSYSFVMSGTFCNAKIDPSVSAGYVCLTYHSFSDTTSLPVTIDQAQIVLYAALGGLLAWFVVKVRKVKTAGIAINDIPAGGMAVAAVIAPPQPDQDPPVLAAVVPPPAQAEPPAGTEPEKLFFMIIRHTRWVREVIGAMLMSVTITIVAGRLSTTQLPVKVSVDDFWGALTVGFVSYFVGGKFLDKLSDSTP